MYSPTSRLLGVLELLQSRQHISGTELAQRLEIHPRTVRRYIQQLQGMGIPVEAERGVYGSYHLKPGQRIPPLLFTEQETLALSLGLLTIRELQFPVERATTETTLAKIERVLPAGLVQHARALQAAISIQLGMRSQRIEPTWLMRLSLAVQRCQQVRIAYLSAEQNLTERTIDAYGIVFNEGAWYLVGYCHLRMAIRVFRLDRIQRLQLLDSSFERPVSINIVEIVQTALNSSADHNQVEVLLKTTIEHAHHIIPPAMGRLELTPQGVLLRRAAVHLEWVAFTLLELDIPVVVLQPIALRELLQAIATKALGMIHNSAAPSN